MQCLRVGVQLLQRVRHVYDGDIGKNHPLVASTQVIQKLLRLRPQLLQLIGDAGREIIAAVLALLPPGNIRFDAEDTALHLPDGLIGGNGENINGQHEVLREIRQLGDHLVLDVAGIVPQKQNTANFAAHLEVVCFEAQPIRADVIPEVMPFLHGITQVKPEMFFFAGTEKIMEDSQTLLIIQCFCSALQAPKIFPKVSVYPMEEGAGLLHVSPGHRNRNVLVLNEVITFCGLVGQDAVVLLAVTVKTVPPLPHQDTAAKVCAVQPSVVDGNFCGGIRGQAVQHSAVGSEHIPLIVMGGQRVVNIRKAPSAAEFASSLPDTVPIDPLDGNGLLDAPGDTEPLPFTAVCGKQGLNHKCSSPFHLEFCSTDFQSGTPSAPRTKSAT